jgi:osmotically-inducible protein OsmY
VRKFFYSLPVLAIVSTGPFVSGCNRSNTANNPESRVEDQLKNANIKDVNANWNKDEKVLHLSGTVKAADEKERAETVANQVVGTTGRVVNEVKVEGLDTADEDRQLESRLNDLFAQERQDSDMDLSFDSKAGVVTIKGNATTQAAKDDVTQRVRGVDGVKDVVNDMEVKASRKPAPPKERK